MEDSISWETHQSQTVSSGEYYEVRRDRVKLPTGEEDTFDYIHEPDAVVILGFTTDSEVLVISEWRQTVRRYVTYGLPGGSIEDGETEEEAALRELEEETGYTSSQLERICKSETTNGFTDGHHTFFIAHNCVKSSSISNSETGEQTSVRKVDFDILVNHCINGTIVDSKTLIPILFVNSTRELGP